MYPNVKYELQELEHLILSGRQRNGTYNEVGQEALRSTISKEVERIKQTFIQEIFSFEDERHLERYIQYHQQALIRLMDNVVGYENIGNIDSIYKEIHDQYYYGLEELLAFVERHFTKYFDQDAKAPETYIAIARKDIIVNLNKLQESLIERHADTQVIEIMLYVLRKMTDDSSRDTTYRKVIYAKEIQKELFRLLENDNNKDVNEELRLIMYYLNYNSIRCFTYHAHYINALLTEAETRIEKVERLSFLLKIINQAQVKPGIGYNLQAPSIQSQLSGYIVEEIDHLERLYQIANVPAAHSLEATFDLFKIHLELSVTQIAYLTKVFIETRMVITNNVTGLLRFLSKFIVSKRSESISYDSLRAKFYNVEHSTKEAVKSMLLKMVDHINKH